MGTLSGSDAHSGFECPPINLIYSHYHNAVRAELDRLSENASELEKVSAGKVGDRLIALRTQCRFLEKIYKYHSSVEDEVVYPALSSKVKNVTSSYTVEHEAEEHLFEQLVPLINSALSQRGKLQAATVRSLICKVEEIHLSLRKHLAKEEDQLFPLLLKHFTFAEQAELVAQFLCCIPLAGIEALLSWLKPAVPQDEQDQLLAQVQSVVPDQLLLQMLVSWLAPITAKEVQPAGTLDCLEAAPEPIILRDSLQPVREPTAASPAASDKPNSKREPQRPPLKEILYLHAAIRTAMEAFAAEARTLQRTGGCTSKQLNALVDRHRFLRSVCAYHQASEDEVLFPAAKKMLSQRSEDLAGCQQCEVEHTQEGSTWEKLGRLLNDVRAYARRGARELDVLMDQLCSAADSACHDLKSHMQREELQVLPILEEKLGHAEQRTMVWETLKEMPLRLLERVMPWLAGKLSAKDVEEMLENMELAAPEDVALVKLLSKWAKRGRRSSPEPQDPDNPSSYGNHTCDVRGSNHKRRFEDSDPDSSLPSKRPRDSGSQGGASPKSIWEDTASNNERVQSNQSASTSEGRGVEEPRVNPIDHIFQFHKALQRELDRMESEAIGFQAALDHATALEDCNSAKLTGQLYTRFRFMWGFYRAHSEAEDDIVFPSLEAKEALINVSHSYTLDHQHESKLFEEVEQLFNDIRRCTNLGRLRQLASKLHFKCAGIRTTVGEHVRGEEHELWPLFAENFTIEEQKDIVGQIIGRTGADVLQATLPWVTESFTEAEKQAMMDSFRSASKNTMFEQWLNATKQPSPDASGGQKAASEEDGGKETGETLKENQPSLRDLVQYLAEDTTGKVDPQTAAKAREAMGSGNTGVGLAEATLTEAHCPSMPTTDAAPKASEAQQMKSPPGSTFKPGWQDIFRMNQKQLETAVRCIQSNTGLDSERKAYLMQNIMASRYIVAQQNRADIFEGASIPTQNGPLRTYHDASTDTLGCPHYKRKCKIVSDCCNKVYGCRHCHDNEEDHHLEPKQVSQIVCMVCSTKQPITAECTKCHTRLGKYHCSICRLWDDQEGRSIYHCPFCNLCRRGHGLGIDACHCMHCNTCMHLSEFKQHTCRVLSACPICTEVLFDSNQPYRELACGHFMHSHCFETYTRYNYTCPTCCKSLGDMSMLFRMIDTLVSRERVILPQAYSERKQAVLCNDCGQRGQADFHFVYHKCPHCSSYNTRLV